MLRGLRSSSFRDPHWKCLFFNAFVRSPMTLGLLCEWSVPFRSLWYASLNVLSLMPIFLTDNFLALFCCRATTVVWSPHSLFGLFYLIPPELMSIAGCTLSSFNQFLISMSPNSSEHAKPQLLISVSASRATLLFLFSISQVMYLLSSVRILLFFPRVHLFSSVLISKVHPLFEYLRRVVQLWLDPLSLSTDIFMDLSHLSICGLSLVFRLLLFDLPRTRSLSP